MSRKERLFKLEGMSLEQALKKAMDFKPQPSKLKKTKREKRKK